MWAAAALALTLLVLVPLAWIFASSLQSDATNQWTFANYVEGFSQSIYLEPIRNSLVIALVISIVAVAIGTLLAWAVSRTDMPGRGMIRSLVSAAFVTPSFLGAIAWIFRAAPNSGWFNKAAVALTGAQHGPFNIYSVPGAILVIALYSYPYAFTFVSSALEVIPPELERSAALLGAGWLRTTFRITLPLALPAILTGALMSFLEALTEFGTPAFLLIPARQQVMTTQIYLFFQFPSRPNLAAAYAIPPLLVAVGGLLLQRRLLGRRRFTTVWRSTSHPARARSSPANRLSAAYPGPMTTQTATPTKTVQNLARQREQIVRELAQLSEADCKAPAEWAGIQRNVNFLLRAFSLHELDHLQHLQKLLAARGRHFNEPQILLSKAQALRGELLAQLLSLSDEEFESAGPNPEDWSPRQLVEHLTQIDARYAETIRQAVRAARA